MSLIQLTVPPVLQRLYRAPLDLLEETTTGQSNLVLVNSNFTKGVFGKTFKRLAAANVEPKVWTCHTTTWMDPRAMYPQVWRVTNQLKCTALYFTHPSGIVPGGTCTL